MKKFLKKMKKNEKGFTLIELIVVIAIIAILAAVIVPRFSNFSGKAEKATVEQNAKTLAKLIAIEIAESDSCTIDYVVETSTGDFDGTLTLTTGGNTVVIDNVGTATPTITGQPTKINGKIAFEYTCKVGNGSTTYTIDISANGEVEVN